MKTAHIFLAAASLATLTVLAGCGTNNNNELSSPGYSVGDLQGIPGVASLALTPQVASAHVGQAVQLQVTANLANGQQQDITQSVTYTSSDPSLASVSASGLVSAKLPGTVTITATSGPLSRSLQFTVNPFINRLFVTDAGTTAQAIRVFATDASGTVSPLRSISGANTGLINANQLAISGQELFVADGTSASVKVFYLQAEGDVKPLRTVKSTSLTACGGVAILNGEMFVSDTNGSIVVFNATDSGDAVVPKRIITGVNTRLTTPLYLSVQNGRILAGDIGTKAVLGFTGTDNGDVAPVVNLTGPGGALFLGPVQTLTSTPDLFVSDQTGGAVYRFAGAANGNDAPMATIQGLNTGLTFPRGLALTGSELFVAQNVAIGGANTVSVFPTSANGNVAPTRTFTSTQLSGINSMVIGGSF